MINEQKQFNYNSEHGHFKKFCSVCGRLIAQCRCMKRDKAILYDICDNCKKNQVEQKIVAN